MSVTLSRSLPLRGGLALAVAGAAFGASALVGGRGGAPAVAPAAADVPHDCAGAEEDLVTVELAPEAVDKGRGGERMAVAIDVHHHFGAPAELVGAVEVIDDRGRRIGPARELAARSLPARSRTAYRIETPERLADGYYRMQASVLARAGDADDFSTHQLYFHVSGGALAPITSHDWLTRSASGLAFPSR